VMIYPPSAETVRAAAQAVASGELPGAMAGLVGDYVERRSTAKQELEGTLYLNASCPLIRRLVEKPPSQEQRDALLPVLHQIARLSCGRLLSAADARQGYGSLTRALDAMIK